MWSNSEIQSRIKSLNPLMSFLKKQHLRDAYNYASQSFTKKEAKKHPAEAEI